jgi:EpsI family protein
MLKALQDIRIKPIGCVKAGVYAIILAFVYQTALKQLLFHEWYNEDYSHCILMPFVILYLIWEKRKELNEIPSRPAWTGLVPFLIGIMLFWLGELGGEYFTLYVSLWLVIIGLLWMHLGREKIKVMWFTLIIGLTMFPFPAFINSRISLQLQLISSKLGVWMVHLYGMPAYREGNVIDLGFTQLQVVEACSGLRYLIPIMVLSLLLAYFFKAHIWKRIVLFLSSIPVAIVMNSLRIALTGILYSVWGAKVAEGFFHGFSGWLIFIFALAVLLVEMWVLSWLWPRKKAEGRGKMEDGSGERGAEQQTEIQKEQKQGTEGELAADGKAEGRWKREDGSGDIEEEKADDSRRNASPAARKVLQAQFVVAIVMLVATLAVSKTVEFREKIPIAKQFNQFPTEIGEWKGTRQTMEQQYLNALFFSDYIIADYRNSQGKEVSFYVAYYDSQRKGESIHSPESCLPGSGWVFRQSGTTNIALASSNPGSISVNRAFMEKPGVKELVYFWFPMRGRVLTKLWEVKVANFWDALTKQRTDGALVRVITPVYRNEEMSEAEERLSGFTRDVVPILDQFIPK